MRRWAASFLLLLTVLLPLQPVLANAQQAAKLPACCRRNGKHHCLMVRSMAFMARASSPAQLALEPPPCSWKMTQIPAIVAALGATEVLESQPATSGHVLAAPWQFLFLPIARSQATRAPPVALL